MDKIAARAGVRSHWHKLRTTFANRAVDAGVPIEDLAIMMGHADPRTTMHYARHALDDRALSRMRALQLASPLEKAL
jgi:integrase